MLLQRSSFARWWALALLLGTLAFAPAVAQPAESLPLLPLSSDPFTNPTSQHQTEVEPDAFSFGSTIVTAFQVGRFYDGGSSTIGWATSQDSGANWTHGFLPGLTVHGGGATYNRVSDPSVAYDAKHAAWLIIALPLLQGGLGNAITVNRSTNGGTAWSAPVFITETAGLDKTWLACDNSATSPFYGNCYAHWSVFGNLVVSVSHDGGLSWDQPRGPVNVSGLSGQPVVRPNGTVVVPYLGGGIASFRSTDGGQSWEAPVQIAPSSYRGTFDIGLRSYNMPTVAIDAAGRVFAAWPACDVEVGCETNDLLMSWTDDGTIWSTPARVVASPQLTISAVLPGLAIEPGTAGASARMGIMFYYYFNVPCARDSGKLFAGFTSSADGGATWAPAITLAGPFNLEWLALTNQGRMVGDYMDVGFAGGRAFPIFSLPRPPSVAQFDQVIATVAGGLAPGVALPEHAISAERVPCRYLPLISQPDPFAQPTPLR
jgi:hypothetical protein